MPDDKRRRRERKKRRARRRRAERREVYEQAGRWARLAATVALAVALAESGGAEAAAVAESGEGAVGFAALAEPEEWRVGSFDNGAVEMSLFVAGEALLVESVAYRNASGRDAAMQVRLEGPLGLDVVSTYTLPADTPEPTTVPIAPLDQPSMDLAVVTFLWPAPPETAA